MIIGGNEYTGLTYMQPLAIEHAAKSGEFPAPFVEELLSAARQFHIYNNEASRFSATVNSMGKYYRSQLSADELYIINSLTESIKEDADEIKKRCNKLLKDLNLQ